MMDAATQDAVARILHEAFHGRVIVSRPVASGARIERWEQQSPQSMIAAWLQKGWRVDLVQAAVDERQLVLIPKEGD